MGDSKTFGIPEAKGLNSNFCYFNRNYIIFLYWIIAFFFSRGNEYKCCKGTQLCMVDYRYRFDLT